MGASACRTEQRRPCVQPCGGRRRDLAQEQLDARAPQRHVPAGRPPQAIPDVHRQRSDRRPPAELKEYVIGVQVFRKEESFDPRTDPIVRVQARRLRAKLVRYYREEGRADALMIELAEGRLRAGVQGARGTRCWRGDPSGRRWSAATRIAVLAVRGPQRRRDRSATSAEAFATKILHRLARLPGLRILAARAADAARSPRTRRGRRRSSSAAASAQSGDRAADQRAPHRRRERLLSVVGSRSTADSPMPSPRRSEWPTRSCGKLEPDLRDAAGTPAGHGAGRKSRREEPVSAGPLSPESADRGRPAQGARLLREGAGRRRAVRAGAQRAGRRLRAARALRRARARPTSGRRPRRMRASAVMLDDDSAEAHTSLAHVKATQDWDWAGAEREFQRAISLNPAYATAHHWYATSCLAPLGRLDEALDEIADRAVARSRSRPSSRAIWPSFISTAATSRPRSSSATTRSS